MKGETIMTIEETIKKNQKTLIKAALITGVVYYLANKYKIVPRKEFNGIGLMLSELLNKGYIERVTEHSVKIVEGLVKPVL